MTRDCAPSFAPSLMQHVKTLHARRGHASQHQPWRRGVSIQAPLDRGRRWYGDLCRKLTGNHMHELLNAIVLARTFNISLFRQTSAHTYTCDGLLQSTGMFEQLPVHGEHVVPRSWCFAGDLEQAVRDGTFQFRRGMYSMSECGTKARWHAQEAALFRFLPAGINAHLFRFGPQYAFGAAFTSYFRFKWPKPRFADRALRIGVHLRHRRACFNGSELIGAVLQLASELAAGKKYMLLVASDRRRSIELLRASGVPMQSVSRGVAPTESAVFAENGVDVGVTAMRDIHLLSFSHHLIGSYGSTYTMLVQELVAYRQAEATVTYCEPGVGCTPARPLRSDWHFSLQHWPKASIIQRAPDHVTHGEAGSLLLKPVHRALSAHGRSSGDPVQLLRGHCGVTVEADAPCASTTTRGAWALPTPLAQSWQVATRQCAQMCLQCEPCRYISASLVHRECSWYATCDLERLHAEPGGFFTFRVGNSSEWRRLDHRVADWSAAAVDSNGEGEGAMVPTLTTPDHFVRIDFRNRSCCSFDSSRLIGHGRMFDRWTKLPVCTLAACLELCKRQGPSCMFVSHMAAAASELGECRRCNLCQLSGAGSAQPCSSWSRQPAELRLPTTFALKSWLPRDELRGPYARRVYGTHGTQAAPSLAALKVVWIDLLGPAQRASIRKIGVCSRAGGTPLQPLFASVLRNALWVHQPGLIAHVPLPSYAWAEVIHCPLRAGPTEDAHWWRYAPMWTYVAPGSGVSFNVGRTLVVRSFAEASVVLQYLFPGTASLGVDALPCGSAARRTGWLGSAARSAATAHTANRPQPRQLLQLLDRRLGRDAGERQLDAFLSELDSLQIVEHTEWYAHTPLHELLLLRQAECQRLTPSMEGLMCGALPALRNCTNGDDALRRVHAGCGPTATDQWNANWRSSKPLTQLIGPGRLPKCYQSLGCFTEASEAGGPGQGHVWCPRGIHRGWPIAHKRGSKMPRL